MRNFLHQKTIAGQRGERYSGFTLHILNQQILCSNPMALYSTQTERRFPFKPHGIMALYSTSIRRLQSSLKTNIKDIAEECCCLSKLRLITEQNKKHKKATHQLWLIVHWFIFFNFQKYCNKLKNPIFYIYERNNFIHCSITFSHNNL